MPNRGKNRYISKNFNKQLGIKITEDENGKPQLTVDTAIPLDEIDIPELEENTRERFPEPKE